LPTRREWDTSIRFAIRVGIHTGLTVIGDIGGGPKHELLALGEAPNIAARIESIAEPNTVAISEVTYRLVRGYFACDDLGFHTPKGVSTSVQVYRVLRESGAQSRLVVYLAAADKYRGRTRRPSQEQTGLDERALMASQRFSHPW
jgi:class 3 adenylate cyclase